MGKSDDPICAVPSKPPRVGEHEIQNSFGICFYNFSNQTPRAVRLSSAVCGPALPLPLPHCGKSFLCALTKSCQSIWEEGNSLVYPGFTWTWSQVLVSVTNLSPPALGSYLIHQLLPLNLPARAWWQHRSRSVHLCLCTLTRTEVGVGTIQCLSVEITDFLFLQGYACDLPI